MLLQYDKDQGKGSQTVFTKDIAKCIYSCTRLFILGIIVGYVKENIQHLNINVQNSSFLESFMCNIYNLGLLWAI